MFVCNKVWSPDVHVALYDQPYVYLGLGTRLWWSLDQTYPGSNPIPSKFSKKKQDQER